MAKALLGQTGSDPRVAARAVSENRRLRQRVADLEAHVLRLQAENDRLAAQTAQAARAEVRSLDEQMQPA